MRRPLHPFLRLHRDRRGAVAVLTAAIIVALAGVGAVAVDVGYAVTAQRQLQASTDAAALAGARDIGSTTNDPRQSATSYSAVAGNRNAPSNLNVTMASGYPLLKCFTSTGVTCVSGKSGYVRQRHPGEAAGERADILWQSDRRQFAEHRGDGHRWGQRRQGDADGRHDHSGYDVIDEQR